MTLLLVLLALGAPDAGPRPDAGVVDAGQLLPDGGRVLTPEELHELFLFETARNFNAVKQLLERSETTEKSTLEGALADIAQAQAFVRKVQDAIKKLKDEKKWTPKLVFNVGGKEKTLAAKDFEKALNALYEKTTKRAYELDQKRKARK